MSILRPTFASIFITIIFASQFLSSVVSVYKDKKLLFSDSKNAAEALVSKGHRRSMYISIGDYQSSTLIGYMQRSTYYLEGKRQGTYVIWDTARKDTITMVDLESAIKRKLNSYNDRDLLVIDSLHFITNNLEPNKSNYNYEKIYETTNGTVVPDEYYQVYKVSTKN